MLKSGKFSESGISCMVCKKSAPRANSVFCSDDCIRKHADTTKAGNSISLTTSQSSAKLQTKPETTSSKSSTPDSENKMKKVSSKSPTSIRDEILKNKKNHVIVYDKKTGRYLTGNNAPTVENYRHWLQEHPNYELVKPGSVQAATFKAKQQQLKQLALGMDSEKELFSINQPQKIQSTLKFDGDKKMTYVKPFNAKQTGGGKKPTTPSQTKRSHNSTSKTDSPSTTKHSPKGPTTPTHKTHQSSGNHSARKRQHSESKTSVSNSGNSSDKEPIRENVRKTLAEQLTLRTAEITGKNSSKLSIDEIKEFVASTEAEIFTMFGNDTNNKYRAKYRSLMFNIKDRKNQTLFQKICNKAIQPKQLVRMSPEELASQELARWRENENKHQLEMITKSELDMLACAKSYVLKTHKGEEVIESNTDRVTLDPTTAARDVVSVLNNSKVFSAETNEIMNPFTPIIVKDNRFEKYFSVDNSSNASSGSGHKSANSKKIDSRRSRSKSKDRHEHSHSSSKHKQKRSRDKRSRSRDKEDRKDRTRVRDRDKERGHDKERNRDKKEHTHSSDKKKDDKKEHRSSNKAPHPNHDSTKEKKSGKEGGEKLQPKVVKKEENYSLIDKIIEAETTIDRIINADKRKEIKTEPNIKSELEMKIEADIKTESNQNDQWSTSIKKYPLTAGSSESDQEPSSTVTIPTPPDYLYQMESGDVKASQIVWNGTISMVDIATFNISARVFSGHSINLEFPDELDIVGRIAPEIVWDYINKIKSIKDVIVVRFAPMSEDDKSAYNILLNYLDSRKRHGVIRPKPSIIKDFYIFPLPAHKSLPTVLQSAKGSKFESGRPDLLIGVIVPLSKRIPVPPLVRNSSMIGTKPTVIHLNFLGTFSYY